MLEIFSIRAAYIDIYFETIPLRYEHREWNRVRFDLKICI